MNDRTQHLIDAIDGALDDWSVGPDAMRWTPEPAAVDEQPRAIFSVTGGLRFAPAGTDPWAVDEWTDVSGTTVAGSRLAAPWWQGAVLAESFGVAIREAAESMARAMAMLPAEAERMLVTLAELQAMDAPEPEDPRARALRLRRERNTGPGLVPAGRQKRPRRLTGQRS